MSADLAWQPRDSQPLSAQGGGSDVMESQFTAEASNQQKENASQMPKAANAPSSTPSATGLHSISATGTPSSSGASGASHVQEWDPTAFLNPSMFSSDLVSNSPVTTNPPQNMTTHFQLDPHSHPHHLQQIAPHPQSHIQNNSVPTTSGSLSHPGPSSATPTMNPLQSNQSATFGQDSFQDGYMQEPVSYGQTYDMYHASQLPRASFEGAPYRPVPSQQATDLSAPMSQLGISQDYMFLPSNGAFQPNLQNGAHLHGSQHPHNQMHNQHLLTQTIPTIPSQTPFDYHPGPHDPQGSLDRISPHARLSPYGNSPISNQNFSNQQDFVGGPGSSDHFGPSDQFTDHFGGLERRPSTAGSVHSLHADFPGDLAIPSQSLMGGAQGGPGGVVPSALHAFHQRNRNGSTSSYHPQLFSSDPGREFMNLNSGPGGASSFGSNVYSGHHQQQFLPEQTFHIAPHALQSDSSRIRSNTGLSTTSESGSSGLGSISYPLSEQSAGGPPSEVAQYIRPLLQQYMETPNRLGFGERTIIVMASKVAQKSYRQERRFLCPPPTAIMIGNAWWTESSLGRDDRRPPRVTISISGESVPPESSVEWSSTSGKPIEPGEVPPLPSSFAQEDISSFQPNGPSTQTFIGRAVGKQLFISDDKQKKVEALVKIVAQGTEDEPERVLGVFPSKPIKVISKPSKKRQSAKNMELCINHGSTVSLFHRLRAQTVSTKYLCVSGSGMSFKGSDGASMPGVDPAQRAATKPSFVVKIGTWDPFIIYIVDMNKPPVPDAAPMPPPYPEYPIPPPNVINMMQHGSHIPIYYNQTVVLQCLTSGVVSPVLIIRKVDHDTTVVGGGLQEGAKGVPDHFCAPGEVCGDPVSQLHKIAFEVYDPNQSAPAPGSPGPTNAFLSCIVDKVNTYKPSSGRTWNHAEAYSRSQSPSYPPPDSPAASSTGSLTDYFSSGGSPVDSSGLDYLSSGQVPSSDGGRVGSSRRAAKRSGTNASAPIVKTTSKARKRVNSIGSDASGSEYVSPSTRFGLSDQSMSSGALWSIDIGENAVWTIVGTEQIRYNFYVPPGMPGARASGVPLKPVTPFPNIVKYLPPDRAAENPVRHGGVNRMLMNNGMRPDPRNESLVTIYGENFSKTDPPLLFFGTELSPFVDVRCQEVLACIPPPLPSPLSSGGASVNGNGVDPSRVTIESGGVPPQSSAPRPIFIARADGVIYPSSILFYSQ